MNLSCSYIEMQTAIYIFHEKILYGVVIDHESNLTKKIFMRMIKIIHDNSKKGA